MIKIIIKVQKKEKRASKTNKSFKKEPFLFKLKSANQKAENLEVIELIGNGIDCFSSILTSVELKFNFKTNHIFRQTF